ncbi:hypothetical protein B0H11DRAFT_2102028 [Mycena galericulata]|nr:hypothetical protein B0H11DRAFT_2102028 [Mycena galericulata]
MSSSVASLCLNLVCVSVSSVSPILCISISPYSSSHLRTPAGSQLPGPSLPVHFLDPSSHVTPHLHLCARSTTNFSAEVLRLTQVSA